MYQLPETSHNIPLFSNKIFSWNMLIEQLICCWNVKVEGVFLNEVNKNTT